MLPEDIEIESIHIPTGLVIFSDQTTGQVDSWLDENGDKCAPEDAKFAIVPWRDYWLTFQFNDEPLQCLH